MSDTSISGFGKFVPGFDFLQNLAKGATSSIPQMPNLSNWVAPTISVEELEKRIDELKAVQFWLEQNSRALSATIQALEVQKMTLATLKGMNFSVGDVANAFKLKTADTVMEGVHKAGETIASAAQAVTGAASRMAEMATSESAAPEKTTDSPAKADASASLIDPMQWWGALTQQFQQIAANAMKDAAKQTALDTTRNMATGLAKEAMKTATEMATKGMQSVQGAARRSAPKKVAAPEAAPARKAAARKAPAKKAPAKKAAPRRPAPGTAR